MDRRRYLQLLAGTGALTGLAGCSALGTDDDDPPATDTRETPAATETPTSSQTPQTPTATPTATPTPEPDRAPRLATATATPQGNGETLAYHVVAEDDNGLQYVAVTYGDQTQEWEDPGRRIDETGQLIELGQPPEEGQVAFVARDTAGQETREQRYPDQQAPTLTQFAAEPTENAGEIALTLQGEDDVGLEQLALLLNGNTQLQQNASGQTQASVDTIVNVPDDATVGEKNTLTAALEDWNGNTTQSDSDTYVRKYDVMEDTRLDIGAEYFPMGEAMFGQCLEDGVETSPAVGSDNYGRPIEPWVTSRHIDQMQGHGIDRIQFSFDGVEVSGEALQTFLEAGLIDEIDVEPIYFLSPRKWNQDANNMKDMLETDMTYLQENILSRENAATYNGRPTVYVSNAPTWVNLGVEDEWGSYENFVNDMREHLTVDGTEPFLIAGMGAAGWYDYAESGNDYETLASKFDAVMNSISAQVVLGEDSETISWEEVSEFRDENFEGHRALADEYGIEFFPQINGGHDDLANTCWGSGHIIPRSPQHLQEDLERAEEYGTADRRNIFTWNDFTEGTAIEPGTFRGNNYGTAYLEKVEQFQQEGG
jgi:hypothetical protein